MSEPMTAERLARIRAAANGDPALNVQGPWTVRELLAHIDHLTAQLTTGLDGVKADCSTQIERWGTECERLQALCDAQATEVSRLAAENERQRAAMALVPVKHLNTLADFLDMEQAAGRWGTPGSTEVQDDIRKLAAAARELEGQSETRGGG